MATAVYGLVSIIQRACSTNQQIKSWASSTLPTLQHHLDMAQKIYKKT
jgi:uncharacterized protein DUF4142